MLIHQTRLRTRRSTVSGQWSVVNTNADDTHMQLLKSNLAVQQIRVTQSGLRQWIRGERATVHT